jgi:gliding motility-associated-like protein
VSANLGGNTPPVGSGAWSIVSGGTGTFSASTSGNSTFTAGTYGVYVLRWTISNGSCTPSTADITVAFYESPSTATAGATQSFCDLLVSNPLGGNTPAVGTGLWSILSGGIGTFSAPGSGNSIFGANVYGTYVLQWTISNGTCLPSVAIVTVNFYQSPTTASAGPAQNLCNTLLSGPLGANSPIVGIGAWSIVSGGTGSFSAISSGNSTFTGNTYGAYVLRWTISNGVCTSSSADVTVTFSEGPSIASVGAGQSLCDILVSESLGGNTPVIGIGEWSIVSGGTGTFSDISSGSSSFTANAYGTYVLRWTITNGICTPSTADITVIYSETPTTASAGENQNHCGSLVSDVLGGNTPVSGEGAWSIVSGGTGAFSAVGAGNSIFTAASFGTYVLRWTISSGSCIPSEADVVVGFYQTPSTAVVGPNQTLCGTFISGSLGGNKPGVGAGAWSIISGGTGSFSAPESGSSIFTADDFGTYVLRWSISNGTCNLSTADVVVEYSVAGVTSNAGPAQNICNMTSVTLSGNNPAPDAGIWTLVSAPNFPSITNPSEFNTTVTGLVPGVYVFKWTISNSLCPPSESMVTITNYANPSTASTGGTQHVCSALTCSSLGGNTPTFGNGTWGIFSGGTGSFSAPGSGNSTFTAGAYGTYVLRWTISNGVCTSETADVTVSYHMPLAVNAGVDQFIAIGDSTILEGSVGSGSGFYLWDWQPAELLVDNQEKNPNTNPLSSSVIFTLTVFDQSTGCTDSDEVDISVGNINIAPIALADYDTTLMNESVIVDVLTNDINSDGDLLTLSICGYPQHGLVILNTDSTVSYSPYADFEGDDAFCYQICDNGLPVKCADTMVYIHVKLPGKDDLTIYNMVTPNDDGENDYWIISGIDEYPDNDAMIFNRWGDKIKVYQSYNNTDNHWDGTNENGNRLPDGTYYYILNVKKLGTYTGWIYLRD